MNRRGFMAAILAASAAPAIARAASLMPVRVLDVPLLYNFDPRKTLWERSILSLIALSNYERVQALAGDVERIYLPARETVVLHTRSSLEREVQVGEAVRLNGRNFVTIERNNQNGCAYLRKGCENALTCGSVSP